jgi:hypothetical protein
MNRLNTAKRIQLVAALVEGSINPIVRLTGIAKHTTLKLLEDIGCASAAYHHHNVRRLRVRRLRCDEIWGFVGAKAKNVSAEKRFSKKIENRGYAVALHFLRYNFVRVYKRLRVTPAVEAGLADHVRSREKLVGLLEKKLEAVA